MFRSKQLAFFVVALLTVSMVIGETSVFANEDRGLASGKVRQLKRIMKHQFVPYRHVVGVQKTGQTVSYATGDDGDLQRGVPWPKQRFVDHGNGTVTDRGTGLMWLKDANQVGTEMDWFGALKVCNDLVFAGHDNWRLPNVREILSIVDFGAHHLAISEGHPFTNLTSSIPYWSSTTSIPHTSQAWAVNLANGDLKRRNKSKNSFQVWSVRRGKQHMW